MLTVSTLGTFQVTDGKALLDEKKLRSVMLTRLFMYLILYRDKSLSTDAIINAIWADEEIDNPVGALKNLMYRLRKSLEATFGKQDYIITSRGSYQWNNEIRILLDTEKFEQIINDAKIENESERAISKYENAISLYQGEFMPNIKECYWISSLNTYYHSVYLSAVKALAELYEKASYFEALEQLSTSALFYENADEQLYCYQVEARMRLNKISLALESYEKAREIMERELGIRKTTILNKVYEELLSMSNSQGASNINEVHEDIVEEDPEGVFFCGYPIFREIYHLEARKSKRSDDDVSLVLLTMEGKKTDTPEVNNFRIRQAMDGMEKCISKSLRVGDVASRYSDSQYILLLPTCNEDLAHLVANRLIATLYAMNTKYRNINIRANIEIVSSDNEMIN